MPDERSQGDWAEVYRAERSDWQTAASRLTELVEALLTSEGVDVSQIDARVKDVDSFAAKLRRKPDAYPNPISDMPDILGLRIITYYEEDIEIVKRLIEREFKVDREQSSVKAALLDPDRFGYLSVHFVVSLRENRSSLPEWKAFAARRAEIQVRTVLQHAWAAIDHKLLYKTEREVPRGLRRGLFRLSALLEVADKEFSRLREQAANIRADYEAAIRAGSLDVELVADSLQAYLAEEGRAVNWLDRALAAGFKPYDPQPDDQKEEDGRALVLRLAAALGINTLAQLDTWLQAALDRGVVETMAEAGADHAVLDDTTIYDLIANLLLYEAPARPGLEEALDSSEWVDEVNVWFKQRFVR